PGCNMAFRAECLQAVGGFDPQFRIAGDDVDLCWRLRDRGWTLGFSPAAMVWHHRRNSIRAYWQQQREYGKAEAQLARKWPHRYNGVGHVTWSGSVYGRKSTALLFLLQPLGRLSGRLHYGLAPWRRNGEPGGTLASMRPSVLPRRGRVAVWSKRWEHPEGKLQRIEAGLKAAGANVRRGGDYD